ncbi:MAG: hypothetical protein WBA00_17195 [Rhodococcus sp. (in: high G+C Gram-positive bacteria)]
MSAESKMVTVGDVEGLRDRLAGIATKIFEVSAKRVSEKDNLDLESVNMTPAMSLSGNAGYQEIRIELQITRADIEVSLDMGVQFMWTEQIDYENPEELAVAFARDFGLEFVLNYMRPIIDQMAKTVEAPPLTLPLDLPRRWAVEFTEASPSG